MSRKVDKFTSQQQQQQQQLSNKVTFHFSLEKKLTRKKFYRFIFAADGDERFLERTNFSEATDVAGFS